MVLVILSIVIGIAMLFFFKANISGIQETAENVCELSSSVLLQSALAMPEMQCSSNTHTQDCVDTTKLLLFEPGRDYTYHFSGNCRQKVTFEVIYPEQIVNEECTISNYPECAIFTIYEPTDFSENTKLISTPASLYYPLTDEYKLGRLIVEIET